MCERCRRLLALLRRIERSAAPLGALGDDTALDVWFGRGSPLFRSETRTDPDDLR